MKSPNSIKQTPFWECNRCKKNSINNPEYGSCPCPRGSCEAEITGKVVTIVNVVKFPKEKTQKQ